MADEKKLPYKIENHCDRFIHLSPTDGFVRGINLSPGLNTVPAAYMEELQALEAPQEKLPNGKSRPMRYPGRELLQQLQQRVRIVSSDKDIFSPQITIYTPEQAPDREDGLPPPPTLDGYTSEKAALAMVSVTTDKEALTRWTRDKRRVVAQAAAEKLQTL